MRHSCKIIKKALEIGRRYFLLGIYALSSMHIFNTLAAKRLIVICNDYVIVIFDFVWWRPEFADNCGW